MTENKRMATIDDLLQALEDPNKRDKLVNSLETWSRIGNKDSFDELGMSKSELDEFLTEFMADNPYENI